MSKYSVNKGFIVQNIDGKTSIFDAEKSELFTFSSTASFIFEKIKKGWDKNKIIEAIVKQYNVSREVVGNDFDELIKDLLEKKIIS